MARRALIEREKRRAALTARHVERRTELKRTIAAPPTEPGARAEAVRRVRFRRMVHDGQLPGIRKASW